MNAISFVHEQLTANKQFPKFKAGDNVTVNYKIVEGNKERIQSFKGDVVKIQGTGFTATFTVRKISDGVGVERLFPLYSPNIDGIVLNKVGKVRRAKLYFLRERQGKAARIKEKKGFSILYRKFVCGDPVGFPLFLLIDRPLGGLVKETLKLH